MKQTWYLLALSVLIAVLWRFPVIYPLKLLVVFFHESSHALATVLTGGKVQSMTISIMAGGQVISQGGSRFITLSAGYLGSLVCGVIIYVIAVQSTYDRLLMAGLGLVIGAITLIFIDGMFPNIFGYGCALAMLLCSRFVGETANDLMLRLIGLTSLIYVPLDILSDTILRSHLRSDARMLAEEVGGNTIFWGVIWMAISLVIIFYCIRWHIQAEKMWR